MSIENSVHEYVELDVDGQALEVTHLTGNEGLSGLFAFDLGIRSYADSPDPGLMLARPARILLRDGFGGERFISGIVAAAQRTIFDNERADLHVQVRPAVYRLTLGRDSRVFNDMTVPDIVKRVLLRTPAPRRWALTREYSERVHTVQYREDDWTFISRLLEEEGIYYWFDHTEQASTLVFSDSSTTAPDIIGDTLLPFAREHGGLRPTDQIEELGVVAQTVPDRFTVSSFDPLHPALEVTATAGDGMHEIYDAPGGGPEEPAVCEARAQNRLECAQATRRRVTGRTSSIRLVPGLLFSVGSHPSLDGRYLVTGTRYEVAQRRRDTADDEHERPYRCWFDGILSKTPYRPPEDTPVSKQAGLQTGEVIGKAGEEIFPDEHGRVRIQLHWDREGGRSEKDGKWMRVAQRGTGSSMLLPRIGWNVLTFMEEGSVYAPTVLSRIHDAEHPPTYPLPAHKTRVVYKTATSPKNGTHNEIYFEDKTGAEEMFWNASKDMNFNILDARGDVVERNQTRSIGANESVTIGSDLTWSVGNDHTVTIGANETIIAGQRGKSVGGNETNTIGGNRIVKAGLDTRESVHESRTLDVGGSVIESSTGLSSCWAGLASIDIGGSLVRTSSANIEDIAGDGSSHTIGGMRFEKIALGAAVNAQRNLTETISGNSVMVAGGFFNDGSLESMTWNVGGALSGSAPKIRIEAKDKIELRCGGSVITIDPANIRVVTPVFDVSNCSDIIVAAGTVIHN